MPFKLAKIAGGPGTATYRRTDDLNLEVQVTSKTVPVRDKTTTTYINQVNLDVRQQVKGGTCGTDNCPPVYPALYRLRVSAPNGTDLKDIYATYIKVLETLLDTAKCPKPFLLDQSEISVP